MVGREREREGGLRHNCVLCSCLPGLLHACYMHVTCRCTCVPHLMWCSWWEWVLCRSTSEVPIIDTTQKEDKKTRISRISGISLDRAFQYSFLPPPLVVLFGLLVYLAGLMEDPGGGRSHLERELGRERGVEKCFKMEY